MFHTVHTHCVNDFPFWVKHINQSDIIDELTSIIIGPGIWLQDDVEAAVCILPYNVIHLNCIVLVRRHELASDKIVNI
jgi:hypothetical protein